MDATPTPPKRPIGYGIAAAAAASVLPVIWLIDATMGGGGDGYGGAGAMLLFLTLALTLTAVGAVAGARRKEPHAWLVLAALALWLLPFMIGMV